MAVMAFTWLYSKPVYPALLPFAVYSTFHFLTYLRTNLIPTIMPSAPGAPQPAIAETIARFVKKNYDASMHLVANLELFLWALVFLWCLVCGTRECCSSSTLSSSAPAMLRVSSSATP